MTKKYELVLDDTISFWGWKLFRIRALISFGSVEAGDLGGYIEKEDNLSHDGNAWVYGDAKVWGNA
ncbi:TPA: polymer-forming cytoskeletal protein, partial [Streptococcus suis]|nr:polymer-forming cytoskeletal protein [Streptococcus suis]